MTNVAGSVMISKFLSYCALIMKHTLSTLVEVDITVARIVSTLVVLNFIMVNLRFSLFCSERLLLWVLESNGRERLLLSSLNVVFY